MMKIMRRTRPASQADTLFPPAGFGPAARADTPRPLAAFAAAVLLAFPAGAAAQAQPVDTTPRGVATTGHGEVTLTPDRAELRIGVETRAEAAGAASERNAAGVQAVRDTLVALGFDPDSLDTVGFEVRPVYDYGQDGPRLVEYVARQMLRVHVAELPRLGEVIDAALAAGANDIPGIAFHSDREEEARGRVLTRAFADARADAEVLAAAADAALGPVLSMSTETAGFPPPRPMMEMDARMASAAGTEIEPPDIVIEAVVSVRWALEGR